MQAKFTRLARVIASLNMITIYSYSYNRRYDECTVRESYFVYNLNDDYLLECIRKAFLEIGYKIWNGGIGCLRVYLEYYGSCDTDRSEYIILNNIDDKQIRLLLFAHIIQFIDLDKWYDSMEANEYHYGPELEDFCNKYKVHGEFKVKGRENVIREYKIISKVDHSEVYTFKWEFNNHHTFRHFDVERLVNYLCMSQEYIYSNK